jgi:hypothetical protein
MMAIYNEFMEKFDNHTFKVKVVNPKIFKNFIRKIIASEEGWMKDTMFKSLKAYIIEKNLNKKETVDYSNFHEFNPYMSMKTKKQHKLNKEKIAKLDLDEH